MKMWSQIQRKNFLCVHKTTFRKSSKTKKIKNKKPRKRLQSLADSGDKTSCSGRFLRPHFQNSFPHTFFLFSTLNSKMSRDMFKLCHKVLTAKIYPINVQILQTIFFQVCLRTTKFVFPQV